MDIDISKGSIQGIEEADYRKLCAAQVISTLSSAVRELVCNSLDAHCSTIEVRIFQFGLDGFDVIDDGSGICDQDQVNVAKRHHTSKLTSFEDLDRLSTFGFRGEALNSLCDLSKSLTILTRCSSNSSGHGYLLEFDRSGNLIGNTPSPRQVGTTVSIRELFHSLPVRRFDFTKNIKNQYQDMIKMLKNYTIAIGGEGKRIIVNHYQNQKVSTVLSVQGGGSLKEAIISVLGSNFISKLAFFSLTNDHCQFDGFVSKPSVSLPSSYQLVVINNRPVNVQKMVQIAHQVYCQKISAISISDFSIIVSIRIPTEFVDWNLSPDKQTVVFFKESEICASLVECLSGLYENQVVERISSQVAIVSAQIHKRAANLSQAPVEKPIKYDNSPVVYKNFNNSAAVDYFAYSSDYSSSGKVGQSNEDSISVSKSNFCDMKVVGQFNHGFIITQMDNNRLFILDQHACDEKTKFEQLSSDLLSCHSAQKLLLPIPLINDDDVNKACQMELVKRMQQHFRSIGLGVVIHDGAADDDDGSQGRVELDAVPLIFGGELVIGKDDVLNMLGWIANQHIHSSTTETGSCEGIIDLFDSASSMTSKRQCIEVDGCMSDRDLLKQAMLQVPRIHDLLASKSCRSAVMVGDVLTSGDMEGIVSKLAKLNQPWNCPHGRPTIRHLHDLCAL